MKKIILTFLIVSILIISGCSNPQSLEELSSEEGIQDVKEITQQETPSQSEEYKKEEISFAKSINDPIDDCISSEEAVKCNRAMDIISASLNQKDGIAIVNIEVVEDIPSVNQLKEVESIPNVILPEIYQYELKVETDGKWASVLFGDIRADTKKSEGGCGPSYLLKKRHDLGVCQDSEVEFSVNKNKVKIIGPLNVSITNFMIKTLYESGYLEDDSIEDMVES